jgi:hypothetical protein
MNQLPYEMGSTRREVVLAALRERCQQRDWSLLAAHVRANHVHIVVEGEARGGGAFSKKTAKQERPSPAALSGKDRGYKAGKAEVARSRGLRGVRSTGEGVQHNAPEGRDPALIGPVRR